MMRVFAGRGPAVIRWVFGAGSGFRVGRTVGGFNFCFSWVFCWCWRGVPFGGEGGGARGYHSMGFRHFPNIS